MAIERSKGTTLWKQIQQTLAGEIVAGRRSPGERLPTENELAERFGVNRHTVRRALAELRLMGLIRVEQGRGMFVRERVIPYRIGRRTRFSENLLRARRSPGGVLLGSCMEPAEDAAAEALDLTPGEPVAVLQLASVADGRRISVSTHAIPAARFPAVLDVYAQEHSITKTFARFGLADYVRKWTHVTARLPSGADARALGQPGNRPVLVVESVNADPDGRPVEYCNTRFASDWVQLVIES